MLETTGARPDEIIVHPDRRFRSRPRSRRAAMSYAVGRKRLPSPIARSVERLRKKLTWRGFVFASIDGYHVIPLGICIGLAVAMLTLLVTGVLH